MRAHKINQLYLSRKILKIEIWKAKTYNKLPVRHIWHHHHHHGNKRSWFGMRWQKAKYEGINFSLRFALSHSQSHPSSPLWIPHTRLLHTIIDTPLSHTYSSPSSYYQKQTHTICNLLDEEIPCENIKGDEGRLQRNHRPTLDSKTLDRRSFSLLSHLSSDEGCGSVGAAVVWWKWHFF